MKLLFSIRRTNALTLIEVLVVAVLVAVLTVVLLPTLMQHRIRDSKIYCTNNLKQIGLASRIWEGDNGDRPPAQVSWQAGGAMELVATGNVAAVFQVMSNELSTPKVLICSQDAGHKLATDFTTEFGNRNISFFVGLEAADKYPYSILSGDDNFSIKGVPVKPGVVELSKIAPLAWTRERHRFTGNIGLADGSVQATTDSGLTNAIINQYDLASGFTNRFRLAIP